MTTETKTTRTAEQIEKEIRDITAKKVDSQVQLPIDIEAAKERHRKELASIRANDKSLQAEFTDRLVALRKELATAQKAK